MKSLFTLHYGLRNYLQSLVLLVGMLCLLSLVGWLLLGVVGITWFLLVGIFVILGAVRFSPRLLLILHGARALRYEDAPYLYDIVIRLSKQAGIKSIPVLYYIPSRSIDVFTTGMYENTAIALSYGIVRKLNTRELTGVLAHEISHISGKDLLVKLIADVIARLTSVMALTGYILIWVYIPVYIMTDETVPLALLIILLFAPLVSVMMQLGLSRSREFRADMEASRLTNDPMALASALEKIDAYQEGWIEKIFVPTRRINIPSWLRTHPLTNDRVNRLKDLTR